MISCDTTSWSDTERPLSDVASSLRQFLGHQHPLNGPAIDEQIAVHRRHGAGAVYVPHEDPAPIIELEDALIVIEKNTSDVCSSGDIRAGWPTPRTSTL